MVGSSAQTAPPGSHSPAPSPSAKNAAAIRKGGRPPPSGTKPPLGSSTPQVSISQDKEKEKASASAQDSAMPKNLPKTTKEAMKRQLTGVLDVLAKKDNKSIFAEPVPVDQIPGYAEIIKSPMDLGTMRTKVQKNEYRSFDQFRDDLELIWANCETFNEPNSIFVKTAVKLRELGKKLCSAALKEYQKDVSAIKQTQMLKEAALLASGNAMSSSQAGGSDLRKSPGMDDYSGVKSNLNSRLVDSSPNVDDDGEANVEKSSTVQYMRPSMFALGAKESELNALKLVHLNNAFSTAPQRGYSGERYIPKPKLDLPSPSGKALTLKPRINPCRPLPGVTNIRLKDYALSMQRFLSQAGSNANIFLEELFASDLLDPKALAAINASSSNNNVNKRGPEGSSNDAPDSKRTKTSETYLTEIDYFHALVNDPAISKEIDAVDISDIDYNTPFGVANNELLNLVTLQSEGYDMKFLKPLFEVSLDPAVVDSFKKRAAGHNGPPAGVTKPSQRGTGGLQVGAANPVGMSAANNMSPASVARGNAAVLMNRGRGRGRGGIGGVMPTADTRNPGGIGTVSQAHGQVRAQVQGHAQPQAQVSAQASAQAQRMAPQNAEMLLKMQQQIQLQKQQQRLQQLQMQKNRVMQQQQQQQHNVLGDKPVMAPNINPSPVRRSPQSKFLNMQSTTGSATDIVLQQERAPGPNFAGTNLPQGVGGTDLPVRSNASPLHEGGMSKSPSTGRSPISPGNAFIAGAGMNPAAMATSGSMGRVPGRPGPTMAPKDLSSIPLQSGSRPSQGGDGGGGSSKGWTAATIAGTSIMQQLPGTGVSPGSRPLAPSGLDMNPAGAIGSRNPFSGVGDMELDVMAGDAVLLPSFADNSVVVAGASGVAAQEKLVANTRPVALPMSGGNAGMPIAFAGARASVVVPGSSIPDSIPVVARPAPPPNEAPVTLTRQASFIVGASPEKGKGTGAGTGMDLNIDDLAGGDFMDDSMF